MKFTVAIAHSHRTGGVKRTQHQPTKAMRPRKGKGSYSRKGRDA